MREDYVVLRVSSDSRRRYWWRFVLKHPSVRIEGENLDYKRAGNAIRAGRKAAAMLGLRVNYVTVNGVVASCSGRSRRGCDG